MYRFLITNNDGDKALLLRKRRLYCLPMFEVDQSMRLVEALTRAGKLCFQRDFVYLLSGQLWNHRQGLHYCVLEDAGLERFSQENWIPIAQLSPQDFADAADHRAIREILLELTGYQQLQKPFTRQGWWTDLSKWLGEQLQTQGLQVRGVRQLNGGPSFNLLRVETNGPAYWFKAVGEPNTREFSITIVLATQLPRYVPGILATLPECNGWLALEIPGVTLHNATLAEWAVAAGALADLQISSIPHVGALDSAGARDLTSATVSQSLAACLEEIVCAMQRQEKASPPPVNEQEVASLGERVSLALAELNKLHIPNTLGHLDLNPGNVIVSGAECTFLDWSEAYVGNPFYSFAYFFEHFRRTFTPANRDECTVEHAYWSRWRTLLAPSKIDRARRLVPLLAVVGYTLATLRSAWKNAGVEHKHAYLRALTRRMKREADRLFDSRSVCQV